MNTLTENELKCHAMQILVSSKCFFIYNKNGFQKEKNLGEHAEKAIENMSLDNMRTLIRQERKRTQDVTKKVRSLTKCLPFCRQNTSDRHCLLESLPDAIAILSESPSTRTDANLFSEERHRDDLDQSERGEAAEDNTRTRGCEFRSRGEEPQNIIHQYIVLL